MESSGVLLPGSLSSASRIAPGTQASPRSLGRCRTPEHGQGALPLVQALYGKEPAVRLIRFRWVQERQRPTDQGTAVFGIRVEILSVPNHTGTQVGDGEGFLFIVALVALGNGLNVGSGGLMDSINA